MTVALKILKRTFRVLAVVSLVPAICSTPSTTRAAEPVTSETCIGCHEGYRERLIGTAHQLTTETGHWTTDISCISCHTGGEVHVEDPSIDNISNPATSSIKYQFEICSSCHQPHNGLNAVGFDPHFAQNVACTDCHTVKCGVPFLLADDRDDLCANCHVSEANEFRRVSAHPLNDGNVTCISCHDFTGKTEPNFGHGQTANCYSCHPEQSGPYLFEHGAASSFAPDGGGCISCHAPHGSPNERLLIRPDNGLCQQCHGVPAGHRTVHDGIGQQYACIECHSDVHGSYDNRSLLDQNLGSIIGTGPGSCWCHNVEN